MAKCHRFIILDSLVRHVLWCAFSVFWQGTTTTQTTFCKEEERRQRAEKMYHDTCSVLSKWITFFMLSIVILLNRYRSYERSTTESRTILDSVVERVLWCIFSVFWQGTTTLQTTFCKEEERRQRAEKMYHDTCSVLSKWITFFMLSIVILLNRYRSYERSTAESRII